MATIGEMISFLCTTARAVIYNASEERPRIGRGLALILMLSSCNAALAVTGSLQGERTSGLNKICIYEGASGTFTKTIGAAGLCPLSADDGEGAPDSTTTGAGSATGSLKGERTSGMNKICIYEGASGAFTKTIGAAQACPLSAQQ